ncbi:MAG: bifunctional (p)ppGpp synthetase/guanosine-3',5'-bis(diphosphate) 3'-pyrophosphohydrolase [Paludibacteraceae bacterium]|nr:bifunctional (p)ppGpp synthetase/guanosine-3',5'-bis(diphosphate) 3'-pyrophosphohydrolase [Paludibacteraceae bacterium]
MPNNYLNTDLLDKAIIFAVNAHHNTERRGKRFPYIVHPLEAVAIVATITNDQQLLAAAALHDTIEDTSVTAEDIRQQFGERIAHIVAQETDNIIPNLSEEQSWHQRKQAAITRLTNASLETKIVALADKLSNIRAIARDYDAQGDQLWQLFHVKDKAEHEWHYRGLADALRELNHTAAYQEFLTLVNHVFSNQ